jgi:PIN domain nuclease of toxin-antitoxin system
LRLLLDTHIWLWSLREPERLARRVTEALTASGNERWLSPVSTWEALVLHAKGRLRLHEDSALWLARATANTREAPLTHEIALAAAQLSWNHRDPADRFLAATAQVLGLTLVTADERLLALKEIPTLANR